MKKIISTLLIAAMLIMHTGSAFAIVETHKKQVKKQTTAPVTTSVNKQKHQQEM